MYYRSEGNSPQENDRMYRPKKSFFLWTKNGISDFIWHFLCGWHLIPCRCLAGLRSTRLDFSMGTMNLCISFRHHLTRRMGSADTARQLRVTTFDCSTSTTTNRPPDQHFHPIFVVRIDGKWVRGSYSATAGRPAHSPGEWRRFF